MLTLLSSVLLAIAFTADTSKVAEQGQKEQPFSPMLLDLRLNCTPLETKGEAVTCDVILFAEPSGGPAIVPRIWPPFRVGRWPEIVMRFLARDAAGAETWLEIAPEAGRGRYDIVLPLSERSLLYLLAGEAHGWRYILNGKDWLLPKEPGDYRIAAELTLRLRQRDASGDLSPGIESLLRDHLELVPVVVPDGVWRSNEVAVRIRSER